MKIFIPFLTIFIIFFGSFSGIHLNDEISFSSQNSSEFSHKPSFGLKTNLDTDLLLPVGHICHLGHSGCSYKIPNSFVFPSVFNLEKKLSSLTTFDYLTPDLGAIFRPPII